MYDNHQDISRLLKFKFCPNYSEGTDLKWKFREVMKPSRPQRKRRASLFTKSEIKRAVSGALETGWEVITFKKGDVSIEMARQSQVNIAQNEWDEVL